MKEIKNDGAKAIMTDDMSMITIMKTDSYPDNNYMVRELVKEILDKIKKLGAIYNG